MITKSDIARSLGAQVNIPNNKAADIVDAVIDIIVSGIQSDGEVKLHGLGAFKTSIREAHNGRNPRTGETVRVAARRVVKFQAAGTLKAAL